MIIVSVITSDIDPVMNVALRFIESIIGALVAVTVAMAVSYVYGLKKVLAKKI